MLSRVWDVNIPSDKQLSGDGDDEIRNLKVDLKERLEQDHFMGGILDPLQGNCDGYHKKLTLYPQEPPAVLPAGSGILQTTIKNSKPELCYYKNDSGIIETQLTKDNMLFNGMKYANDGLLSAWDYTYTTPGNGTFTKTLKVTQDDTTLLIWHYLYGSYASVNIKKNGETVLNQPWSAIANYLILFNHLLTTDSILVTMSSQGSDVLKAKCLHSYNFITLSGLTVS